MIRSLAVIFALISVAYGYSAGAPESTCDDMTPKHPVQPQSTPFPYKVKVDKTVVKTGEEVAITVTGDSFKGFFLQVRKGDNAIGSFVVDDKDKYVKTIDCHGAKQSGATHKNAAEKKDLVIKWKAPEVTGSFKVYATVALDGGTFWVRNPTETIKVQ